MELNHIFVGPEHSNTLIIFLHEGLGSIKQWKSFPKKLCENVQVRGLIYDRSGYGQSPGDLTNRETDYLHVAVTELLTFAQPYKKQYKHVFLYGHSDGGSIALIAAAMQRDFFDGIITEAAHVFVEPETVAGVHQARERFIKGDFDGLKKYHGQRYMDVFFAWNDIWSSADFRNWDITSILPEILCPQLIIQGQNDEYGTLKQVESIVRATKGKATTFTPDNCGHAPHQTQSETIISVATNFVKNIIS